MEGDLVRRADRGVVDEEAVEYARDRLTDGADAREVAQELIELGFDGAALRSTRKAAKEIREIKKMRWSS